MLIQMVRIWRNVRWYAVQFAANEKDASLTYAGLALMNGKMEELMRVVEMPIVSAPAVPSTNNWLNARKRRLLMIWSAQQWGLVRDVLHWWNTRRTVGTCSVLCAPVDTGSASCVYDRPVTILSVAHFRPTPVLSTVPRSHRCRPRKTTSSLHRNRQTMNTYQSYTVLSLVIYFILLSWVKLYLITDKWSANPKASGPPNDTDILFKELGL